jgi:hypothetical protein
MLLVLLYTGCVGGVLTEHCQVNGTLLWLQTSCFTEHAHYELKIYVLKVCGVGGALIQLLCLETLSIVLFLFKTNNVPESGFCLRLQVDPIDKAGPYLRRQS